MYNDVFTHVPPYEPEEEGGGRRRKEEEGEGRRKAPCPRTYAGSH
jgi:hypothetical protein